MIASRRAASATGPSTACPAESGPRWRSAALIAARPSGAARPAMPQIPHMTTEGPLDAPLAGGHEHERLREDREVQADPAVGDVLEVVHELLGPCHLAREPQLGQSRDAGAHDEALPVGRDLQAQRLEERRPDRTRAGEAHGAAHDVVELRELVELERAQDTAYARDLGLREQRELVAQVRRQAGLGVGAQRAQLV